MLKSPLLVGAALFGGTLLVSLAGVETVHYFLVRKDFPVSFLERRHWIRWSDAEKLTRRSESPPRLRSSFERVPRKPERPHPADTHSESLEPILKFNRDMMPRPYLLGKSYQGHSILKSKKGRLVYDVEVGTDEFGRRETSNPDPARRTNFLLTVGCSFMFGEGARDDETFASWIAREAPQYRVYNYGLPGAGAYTWLSQLQDRDFAREVPEKDGVAIHVHISDHIRRIVPSIYYWQAHDRAGVPYFEFDSSGELRRYTSYGHRHPFLDFMYRLMSSSMTLAYYRFDYPTEYGAEDFRLAARLMRAMSDEYERRFHNRRFYVVLFPEGRKEDLITPHLDELGVKYLDYQHINLASLTSEPPTHHPKDGHPTPEVYGIVARQLASDLGLRGRLEDLP